jgi:WD40 repeat protein
MIKVEFQNKRLAARFIVQFLFVFYWALQIPNNQAQDLRPGQTPNTPHETNNEESLGPPVAEGTSLWRADCSIIDPDEAVFSKLERKQPPMLNANDTDCYNAIPVPEGVTELPPYFAWVGKDKKHCVIPITKEPEKHLELGDILVYFRNVNSGSTSLYEQVAKGRWHAAVVTEENGKLFHLDSPMNMSGDSFKNSVYHIIRARKYPPKVKNSKTLKEWQADPEKKKLLDDYAKERDLKLGEVQKAIRALKKAGYRYDADRKTEVTIKKEREKLQKQFKEQGTCSELSLYSSELAITPFVMVGFNPPKSQSLLQSLERIEKEIIPKIVKAEDGKSKEKIIDEALDHLFSDQAMLREMGVDGNQITAMMRGGEIPEEVAKAKALYRALFLATPLQRVGILIEYQNKAGTPKGQIIGPSDLFDAIYDPEGDFSYVGTHVGDVYCRANTAGARLGGNTSGETDGGGSGPDILARENKNHLNSLYLHQQRIKKALLSPNGDFLITSSEDNTVKIRNLILNLEFTVPHMASIEGLELSPDGKILVTGSQADAKIIEMPTGRVLHTIPHGGWVSTLKISPDNKILITGSQDKKARIIDVASGLLLHEIPHGDVVKALQLSPDEKILVTGSRDKKAQIIDLASGRVLHVVPHANSVGVLALSPDSKTLITGSQTEARIIDVDSGRVLHVVPHGDWVTNLTVSPDGKNLLSSSFHLKAMVINVASGVVLHEIPHDHRISDFVQSPDGMTLFTGSWDKKARIIDVASGHVLHEVPHEDPVGSLRSSPDGKTLITSSRDKKVRIIDVASGRILREMKHQNNVSEINLSKLGKYLVATSGNEVHFFNTRGDATEESHLAQALNEYDNMARLRGDERKANLTEQWVLIKLMFEKAKESRNLSRDQALKIMNSNVSTAEFRGYGLSNTTPPLDRHILGIIDTVFPIIPPAPSSPSPHAPQNGR